jgi:hypothetical protein
MRSCAASHPADDQLTSEGRRRKTRNPSGAIWAVAAIWLEMIRLPGPGPGECDGRGRTDGKPGNRAKLMSVNSLD